jgi:hypothetical protein
MMNGTLRTQGGDGVHSALERVREVAKEDRKRRFTALLHRVYDVERLRAAFLSIERDAAAGVDGETWEHYRRSLEGNLQDLSLRLKAGVMADGKRIQSEVGTVQGGRISPLPANIYLHCVFDLWVHRWRQKQARGDVIVVRFADDFAVGFEHRVEAERFLTELRERFAHFGLNLHPVKTRLIEFGRCARRNREDRGDRGAPETFNFLGFTHSCGKTRKGRFTVLWQTMRKRLQAKLKAVKAELKAGLHDPIPEVGRYLRAVVLGHVHYYGVPRNGPALAAFRRTVGLVWWRVLRRRSQGNHLPLRRMQPLLQTWLPQVRICHPYPNQRIRVTTRGGSRMR